MSLTAEQKAERIKHLGSSDMAAVLGVDPWRTPTDVWLEKTDRLIERPASAVMDAGSRFEGGVLDWAEEQLGPLQRNVVLSDLIGGSPLVSRVDALAARSGGEPVEAKTGGLLGPLAEWWGEEGTDQVPERVVVQCHVHMICADVGSCHVPTFLGGRGFAMFQVPRHEGLAAAIREKAREFWQEYVLSDTQPPDSQPSLAVAKYIRRIPDRITDVDPALVQRWLLAKEAAADAKTDAEEAAAEILAAMGEAEAARAGEMGGVTYFQTNRKGFTTEPTSFRTLRYRKKGL